MKFPIIPLLLGSIKNWQIMFSIIKQSVGFISADRTEDKITVTDLNSTNGTTVAGVLLAANETAELNPGDEVQLRICGLCGNKPVLQLPTLRQVGFCIYKHIVNQFQFPVRKDFCPLRSDRS
ncbi:MAG: FHA domain-containing protein [Clostridium sp.]